MNSEDEKARSELVQLLEKNACGSGLGKGELERAVNLIKDPQYSAQECWLCEMHSKHNPNSHGIDKAIYDIGLCQAHALYVLYTRK